MSSPLLIQHQPVNTGTDWPNKHAQLKVAKVITNIAVSNTTLHQDVHLKIKIYTHVPTKYYYG